MFPPPLGTGAGLQCFPDLQQATEAGRSGPPAQLLAAAMDLLEQLLVVSLPLTDFLLQPLVLPLHTGILSLNVLQTCSLPGDGLSQFFILLLFIYKHRKAPVRRIPFVSPNLITQIQHFSSSTPRIQKRMRFNLAFMVLAFQLSYAFWADKSVNIKAVD